ncbi:hypothetical protein [Streptomyces poriticola]|uniref:hypothetical protein n=1 Tax=Streptomyces poriticola TaxID=3120506 RepID=UPI002FCE5F93
MPSRPSATTRTWYGRAGRGTRIVGLAGGTLLPGINDAHLHGCAFGRMTRPPLPLGLTPPAVRSIAGVAGAVRVEHVLAKPDVPNRAAAAGRAAPRCLQPAP